MYRSIHFPKRVELTAGLRHVPLGGPRERLRLHEHPMIVQSESLLYHHIFREAFLHNTKVFGGVLGLSLQGCKGFPDCIEGHASRVKRIEDCQDPTTYSISYIIFDMSHAQSKMTPKKNKNSRNEE